MKRAAILLGLSLLSAAPILSAAEKAAPAVTPQAAEFFEKQIRPVLAQNCFKCHGPTKHKGGLRLDSRIAMLAGNDSGPAIVPGNPDRSILIQAIRYNTTVQMPPQGKLPADAIVALTAWVKMGAPWPTNTKIGGNENASGRPHVGATKHWAFQPVRKPTLPAVHNEAWAVSPIDSFILAKLEANHLGPAPPADKRTLIRRATYDLTGLPPTLKEIAAFEGDKAPDAFAKVVDRLLQSPRYGERWGRFWLDIARYADTKGYVFTEERGFPYSYTFRDYIIRAFNEDLPYDKLIEQQLAADLLPLGEDKRPLAAMGFLTVGRRFLNSTPDIMDDRIDVVSRGLLGLTVSCARCHDHKFDPIPTKDYYSLYGVFASSVEPPELPLIGTPKETPAYEAFLKEMRVRQAKLDEFMRKTHVDTAARARTQITEYLLAVNDLNSSPRRGRRDRSAGGLSFALVRRWQTFLRARDRQSDPIFGPWQSFASLDKMDFAKRAPELASRIANGSGSDQPINPTIARAFAGKTPNTLKEVAGYYGAVFADVENNWKKVLENSVQAKGSPHPQGLTDASQEALRRVLHGPDAPTEFPIADLGRYVDRPTRDQIGKLRRRIEEWKVASPGAPPRAMVLVDMPSPVTPHVLLRGNPNNPGPAVSRQFLEVLSGPHRQPFRKGSGRLELARAIADKNNPLTARVMVNRIWQHHFGLALVRTPSDFGLRSEPPTHPELLDYLAARFMDEGWSIKKMHRLIMLSRVYQQQSEVEPDPAARAAAVDPDNRWLWKMNRRRLDFEAMRDSLLAVSGKLDLTMGGRSLDLTQAPFTGRRTVYGFIDRQNLPGLFRTFDFASPDTSSAQRIDTTVPQQALFLLNSPFVVEQVRSLAAQKEVAALEKAEERIAMLYRRVYARNPEPDEVKLGLRFLEEARSQTASSAGFSTQSSLTPWEKYAQVLLLANEFAFVD